MGNGMEGEGKGKGRQGWKEGKRELKEKRIEGGGEGKMEG